MFVAHKGLWDSRVREVTKRSTEEVAEGAYGRVWCVIWSVFEEFPSVVGVDFTVDSMRPVESTDKLVSVLVISSKGNWL